MADLTIEQLIKIILGIIVVVAVIAGVYIAFKNYVFDLFKVSLNLINFKFGLI